MREGNLLMFEACTNSWREIIFYIDDPNVAAMAKDQWSKFEINNLGE